MIQAMNVEKLSVLYGNRQIQVYIDILCDDDKNFP